MKKDRVTSHNGRWGSAKHNGRNFDLTKAKHIDAKRQRFNRYKYWDIDRDRRRGIRPSKARFEEAELRYYKAAFGKALYIQNEKHKKNRQYGRIKDMAEWMKAYQYRPEETILQIGDMNAHIDPDKFIDCVAEFMRFEEEWSKKHGNCLKVLDVAFHMDEESYHAHKRRVWQYVDQDGVWQVGQNKALEYAGVPLPDPSKPIGPKNNRKMTLDAVFREKWMTICEEHGFVVEREPDKSHTDHLPKADYIRMKELDRREAALKAREAALQAREEEVRAQAQRLAERLQEAEEADKRLRAKEAEYDRRLEAVKQREILCGRTEKTQRVASPSGRVLPQIDFDYE